MRNNKGQFIKGNIENLGTKRTEETKKRMSDRQKGIKKSEETKRKISETNKRKGIKPTVPYCKSGKEHFRFGKHLTEEHKEKIRKNRTPPIHTLEFRQKQRERFTGEKNPLWKGGISNNPYPPAWTKELKQAIRQRDIFVCKICQSYPSTQVHHIDYNKENCEPENLITLCRSCHAKTNKNRDYWIKYFTQYE